MEQQALRKTNDLLSKKLNERFAKKEEREWDWAQLQHGAALAAMKHQCRCRRLHLRRCGPPWPSAEECLDRRAAAAAPAAALHDRHRRQSIAHANAPLPPPLPPLYTAAMPLPAAVLCCHRSP